MWWWWCCYPSGFCYRWFTRIFLLTWFFVFWTSIKTPIIPFYLWCFFLFERRPSPMHGALWSVSSFCVIISVWRPRIPFYWTANPRRDITVPLEALTLEEQRVALYLLSLPQISCNDLLQAAKDGQIPQFFSKSLSTVFVSCYSLHLITFYFLFFS